MYARDRFNYNPAAVKEKKVLKTTQCGELGSANNGQTVQLAGWVNRRRDHGNLIFVDLRDRSGIVQIVFNPEINPSPHKLAESVRNEWVLQVSGQVTPRSADTVNSNMSTGAIEIAATELVVLNESKTPPFYINEESDVDELLRMRYRYLDLRRPSMRDMLQIRHKAVKYIRDFLDARGFLDVETPILIKSTPEGARDYLVPSRLYPGKFYALPQSPQQLKQLLMAAGVEKYYQIAKCFRDEDPRGDRQPEFTQLDLEMSFADEDDILDLIESLYTELFETFAPDRVILQKPFPRISFNEAMQRFGTDRPDIRYGMEMSDLVGLVENTDFQVFQTAINSGGIVKGFSAPGLAEMPRRQLDDLVEFAKGAGAQGLVYIALASDASSIDDLTQDHIKSPVAKFLSADAVKAIAHKTGANPGDLLLIVAGPSKSTNTALDALRRELAERLHLADPNVLAFMFVVDWPLFIWNEEESRWDSPHHPFTAPQAGHEQDLESAPGAAMSRAYDLVCNGLEAGGGSIRIHQRDLQNRVFQILGYTNDQTEARFKQILDAFDYGTPPHGGIATGIERLMMLLLNNDSIREVIAFPKTQSFIDPLFEAPDFVEEDQLKELSVRVLE